MKLGLVINPGSERNKRGLAQFDAAAGQGDILAVYLEDVAELPGILAEFARKEVGAIVVAAGDGTVQATLTQLFTTRPFETPPPLGILPRGMTNLDAGDVGGLRGTPAQALGRLLGLLREGGLESHLETRHVLRLDNLADDHPPQWGMFLGVAGMVRGTRFCLDKVHGSGLKHQWATTATLIGLLAGRLFGKNPEVFEGREVSIGLDNAPPDIRRRTLVIATTLDRLILGSRPFWNLGSGPVRYSSIADPPRGLLRHACRVLYGGDQRKLPPETYESRSCHRLEIGTDEEVVLDGQFYPVTPGKPLVVTAEDKLRFVRA